MTEVWKDVIGYEGYYQVSNFGRVRSVPREVSGKFYQSRIRSTKTKNPKHYEKISLHVTGDDTYYKVHQLVARTFIPNPEHKREVNHIDGNKHNNHVDNLEWVTSKENKEHNHRLGITRRGSRHQNSVIDEKQAKEIKEMLSSGISRSDIAKHLDITYSVVQSIYKGETWNHV